MYIRSRDMVRPAADQAVLKKFHRLGMRPETEISC